MEKLKGSVGEALQQNLKVETISKECKTFTFTILGFIFIKGTICTDLSLDLEITIYGITYHYHVSLLKGEACLNLDLKFLEVEICFYVKPSVKSPKELWCKGYIDTVLSPKHKWDFKVCDL